jgi:hypothetical protein
MRRLLDSGHIEALRRRARRPRLVEELVIADISVAQWEPGTGPAAPSSRPIGAAA